MKNNSILLEKSIELLSNMFDDKSCCFSYSTRIIDGKYVNDFDNPLMIRYTINSYLGIMKFNKTFSTNFFNEELEKFLKINLTSIDNLGDKGLLLYLLSLINHELSKKIAKEFIEIKKEDLLNLSLQEICWILLGMTKYFEFYNDEDVLKSIDRLFKLIINNFFVKDTLFPIHSKKSKLRQDFVSFGGIVYFLKSLYEFANLFGNNYALVIFKELTQRIISLQGKDGAWGWFYNNKMATVVDWFQIYSVHQDAMAFLFLFPAQKLGITGVNESVTKSINWLFGDNILNQQMIQKEPFFIIRSIRRKSQISEKFERILRAYKNSILRKNDILSQNDNVELNKECRSYHIGWIIYAWCEQDDFKDFHNLSRIVNM